MFPLLPPVRPLLLAALWALTAGSALGEPLEAQRRLAQEEQAAIKREVEQRQVTREEQQARLAALSPEAVTPLMLERARVDAEGARVALESAELDLQAAQHTIQELATAVADLEKRVAQAEHAAPPPAGVEPVAALSQKRSALEIERQRLHSRQSARSLAEERLLLAEEWLRGLQERYRSAQERNQQVALEVLRERLGKQQQEWLAKATQWRRELEELPAQDERRRLVETRIQDAEERGRLLQQRIRLAELETRLEPLRDVEGPPELLQERLIELTALGEELAASDGLLRRRIEVLQQQQQLAGRRAETSGRGGREEMRLIERLLRDLEDHRRRLGETAGAVEPSRAALQQAHEAGVRRGLLVHRALPHDIVGWVSLSQGLLHLPGVFAGHFRDSVAALFDALGRLGAEGSGLLAMLELGWLALAYGLRRLLAGALARTPERPITSFTANALLVPVHLLQRTLLSVTAGGALLLPLWATGLPQPASSLLATVVLAWVAMSIAVQLAWALLLSPQVPLHRRRPRLYRQLRWMIVTGGTLTAIVVLSRQMAVPAPLINFTDRLFTLFLLLLALPTLEARRLALELLSARLAGSYWMRVFGLLTLLVPISMVAAAGTGLAGYINLAWAIGQYLGVFLIILAAWLMLSRLLGETAEGVKRRAYRDPERGELWAKGVVEPLHYALRLLLFAALWSLPLGMFGITLDSPPVSALIGALRRPLFSVADTTIHLQGLLLTALALWATLRLARWIRMVAFRWAFAHIGDQGIRHSLSVFTQYAVVLLGLLAALRMIGIDLTTLAIFAGALGVGIGFGLQNIANNFISGLLLLIERPLRAQDIVRVGEYEGEVTHIGMRSLTVKTWDNQEVIMPNSDVISNAFTNWTRSDNIVRTVVTLPVSYKADPHRAKEIIEPILSEHPAVEADPQPAVWLLQFGPSSVDFHIQYFIDLGRHSRMGVRSEILFRIWDGLKAAGIEIPYTQHDLYIKEFPAIARPGVALASPVRSVEERLGH